MVGSPSTTSGYPVTPDGHYFLWNGWQLWRRTNPNLADDVRASLTKELMAARRAVGQANKSTKASDKKVLVAEARARVQKAKEGLGERGPVWWDEEKEGQAVDRKHVKITQYKEWAEGLGVSLGDKTRGMKRKAFQDEDGGAGMTKRITRSTSKRQRTGDDGRSHQDEGGGAAR
ncbi:unnamed protein product [Tilletia controversa]|uniref:Uncharacterized protein n=3 Tax=Tilletia TaxID=13289 RepID=A0A8X7MPR6_9BASI|nr:hypothetical protein CF336_g5955 [Tilletia laevis]KAE8191910.1 hypothetical protein CF328_g5538 [Tilletia controversa]KAE8256650.1 hypothetical protein A4X03_0g5192 [Tilletia caries]KAE8194861.1 hypothetical protein CF335_g5234 [Tilletia laevis]KAE8243223.1 hypothetical protein A4X06_0g6468 [Tilletia controversa]